MDKLKLMRSFVAVVRAGSFLSAAPDISASRSRLSKHLNQLEINLGVQLLNRDTHSKSLTEIGAGYFDFCVRFLSELEEVEAAITERARRPQGTLRILAPLYFGGRFLGSAIADFSNIYRDLNVSINLWGEALQSSDVIGRSYDIVIRTIPPLDSNLKVRKVAPIRNVVCASHDYLRLHRAPDTPSDLSKHPCMYHRKDSDCRWRFTGPEGNISVRLPAAMMPRTNSLEILRHMVLGGRGIGILAEYAVYEDLAAGTLTELLPACEAEARGLFLLFPDAQFSPLKVRLFVDLFVERFGAVPWATARSAHTKFPADLL